MNISTLFGFIILGATIYGGILTSLKQPQIFFDQRALIFVVGGTLAAALLAYPYAVLSKSVDYILWGLVFRKKKQYLKVSQEIGLARNSFLLNQNFMTNDDSHPFFRECALFLLNKNINNDALKEILKNRLDQFKQKYYEDYHVLKSLTKYPIAFGILAALTGFIEMMQTGQNNWNYWVSALVSVFWGVSLSYFIIWPFADSAYKAAQDDFTLRSLVVDGMMLIRLRATDDHFQAYLRGYLSLTDRSEFKIFSQQSVYPFAVNPKIENQVEVEETPVFVQLKNNDTAPTFEIKKEVAVQIYPRIAASENVPLSEAAGDDSTKSVKKHKIEHAGRVESSIHIDPKAHAELSAFDFKNLRSAMKLSDKKKKRSSIG